MLKGFGDFAALNVLADSLEYCLARTAMFQELKFQFSTAILTILTLAASVSAVINFEQQNHFRLPDDGYRPRPADERIGVFVDSHKDYTDIDRRDSAFRHLAQRWDVRPSDPSKPVSPAVEPITFYVDHGVPAVKARPRVGIPIRPVVSLPAKRTPRLMWMIVSVRRVFSSTP